MYLLLKALRIKNEPLSASSMYHCCGWLSAVPHCRTLAPLFSEKFSTSAVRPLLALYRW